ncbi:MAG: hypothetical protein IIT40_12130, partial [Prevotella sp.]|nr:hypothetical protein [Prevotella sp.]
RRVHVYKFFISYNLNIHNFFDIINTDKREENKKNDFQNFLKKVSYQNFFPNLVGGHCDNIHGHIVSFDKSFVGGFLTAKYI